jgi:hypothetical protein
MAISDPNPTIQGGTDGTLIGNDADSLKVKVTNSIVINPDNTFFAFGFRQTAATTEVPIYAGNTYVEQATAAQRSLVSSSANDAAAGTGARTVQIKYYNNAMEGPFFTTVTLNGTTAVNTTTTDIRFVERMEVLTAGSGAQAAGNIQLRTGLAGGGSTFVQIDTGTNQTFYAHHYVAVGETSYVSGISVSHSGTTVGSGAVYRLRKKDLGADTPRIQVSDFVRLYGQSSTFSRVYQSPIIVTGPAYLALWVAPESASSFIYRGSFDYYQL